MHSLNIIHFCNSSIVVPSLSYPVKSVASLNVSEVCEINDNQSTKLSFELFLANFNLLEYKFFGKSLDHLKLDKN